MPADTLPTTKTATLTFDGKTVSLPVVTGSEQESAVDIQKLRATTGLITMDPGYGNTGACKSAITFIDGEKGILRYRGYDIAELAEKSTFLEVAWLLLHGKLPTADELTAFTAEVTRHTLLNENLRPLLRRAAERRASDAGLRRRRGRAGDVLSGRRRRPATRTRPSSG